MTDDDRWQAVLKRDRGRDGAFVYAVRSTGVFCRPSCPSRKPGREQVVFFDLAEAAVLAGFRACRRCRPEAAVTTDPRVAVVRRLCQDIQTSEEAMPTLNDLAATVGMSPHHVQRLFKAVMGVSPKQYADALRIHRLKRALRDGEGVAAATYGVGYGSSSRLYEKAPALLGMTPASYAKGGRGARIRFAIADCHGLGRLLVATTDRGFCMVAFGDSDTDLEDALRAEYPVAHIHRDIAGLDDHLARVLALIDGQAPHPDLPLDVRATAFQWLVWQYLQTIPRGESRTYGEIAAALGKPGAARAVGRSCATNPVAVVVPCHRAIGGDGAMHGYRWGIERKVALLEAEQKGEDG